MANLYGLDRESLAQYLADLGAPTYHADQIRRWLYARREFDPQAWTDLPKSLRARLASDHRVDRGRIADTATATDGTVKYAIDMVLGGRVECVLMRQRDRVTLCVSSQVGCALACDFCLTGRMGLVRHLEVGEIVGQISWAQDRGDLGERPFNVVFMGMGEPLHNYDAVLAAVRLLTDPNGPGLSRRRITVSTAGLAPAIERMAREPVRPHLAVSLNATTDELRSRLMPINRRYPIERLLEACSVWWRETGERHTFEYVLLGGLNDSAADVDRLSTMLRGRPAKLNLIPFNPVPGWLPYQAPDRSRVIAIRDTLLDRGVAVSIRWSRGAEARAACGQLAVLSELSGAGTIEESQ